jgi:hypothetical protein
MGRGSVALGQVRCGSSVPLDCPIQACVFAVPPTGNVSPLFPSLAQGECSPMGRLHNVSRAVSCLPRENLAVPPVLL